MTPHGLVIGKFMPPHDGHRLLIRAAGAAASERVTVLALGRSDEPIPLEDRVRWLREVHAGDANVVVDGVIDELPNDFADPDLWEAHVALYRAALPAPVTAVFSSEPYGEELARRLGARSVVVDAHRELIPISATDIRRDPVRLWDHIADPARTDVARRVVVIGVESTGKTTLSLALVDALRARGGSFGLTRWVPEFGRDFTLDKLAAARAVALANDLAAPAPDELVWTSDEFEVIARRQNDLEDEQARIGGPVLVCDTDAFATAIWHERYMGGRSPATEELTRAHPLYLLTHHDDVPFEQDGIRDGEGIRAWMTERFVDALASTGRRTVVLRGTHDDRVAAGLAAIDELLAESWF